jgi:hypothetical protein
MNACIGPVPGWRLLGRMGGRLRPRTCRFSIVATGSRGPLCIFLFFPPFAVWVVHPSSRSSPVSRWSCAAASALPVSLGVCVLVGVVEAGLVCPIGYSIGKASLVALTFLALAFTMGHSLDVAMWPVLLQCRHTGLFVSVQAAVRWPAPHFSQGTIFWQCAATWPKPSQFQQCVNWSPGSCLSHMRSGFVLNGVQWFLPHTA